MSNKKIDILPVCVTGKCLFHNPEFLGVYTAFLSFCRNLTSAFREPLIYVSSKRLS